MICRPPNGGRLNAFQQLMLHWSELYPYNATHTYKIAGPLRRKELQAAIVDTYWHNGLGYVELSPDGQRFRHTFDPDPPLAVLDGGRLPEERLTAHLSEALNRPFERPRCRPLRLSVVEAGPEAHYLNVVYDHWTADSVTARLILGQIVGRYCRLAMPENEMPLSFYSGTYRNAFAGRLRGTGLAAATLRSLGSWAQTRLAGLPARIADESLEVRYEIHRTRPGTVAGLCAFARRCGATVHDVILAALGRALAEFVPGRSRCRGGIGLGTIVDTRADADEDLDQSLGLFLAYHLVRWRPTQNATLAALTKRMAAVTGPIKANRRYLDSLVSMTLANGIWRWLADRQKPRFAEDIQPLDAGVSNVVVRNTWIDRAAKGHVLECFRGASTGPTLPLVLSPTTLGDEMNLGVSYRVAAFSSDTIRGIIQRFLDQIENPIGEKRMPLAA